MTDDAKTESDRPGDEISTAGAEEAIGGSNSEASSDKPSVEPVENTVAAPSGASRAKWHDRKWLLATIVTIVALLIGVVIGAPDRQAAKDEARTSLAEARSDASDLKDEAQDDSQAIIDDAKSEREALLGGVEKEKADVLKSIEASRAELAKVGGLLRKAKAALATTERTRVQTQKKVDGLNRSIRSSTSLSRENAVEQAQGYLDTSSFSCQGLIDQLSSEYGGQFSVSDATYAAKQVGLC